MRVMVTGSREWTDRTIIRAALSVHLPPGATLVHGAARGVDTIAAQTAEAMGNPVDPWRAQWRKDGVYNPRAGFERNIAMLASDVELVLAFHLRGSGGTAHAIAEAKSMGIPVKVWSVDGDYTRCRFEVFDPPPTLFA